MKSILAIAATLSILSGQALAQPLKPKPGPLAVPGSYAATRAPVTYTPQPVYTQPPPYKYTAPKPPTQPEPFKPYKPKSVYSTRGGIDSYPKPAKLKGYVDLR